MRQRQDKGEREVEIVPGERQESQKKLSEAKLVNPKNIKVMPKRKPRLVKTSHQK